MVVPRKLLNSSTSTPRMRNVATMTALPIPPKLSCRLSISPAGTMRYPTGRWSESSAASTVWVSRLVL